MGKLIYNQTENDYRFTASVEDMHFLQIMDQGFCKDSCNSWVAPLPFRTETKLVVCYWVRLILKLIHVFQSHFKGQRNEAAFCRNAALKTFMQKVFENEHAEVAPTDDKFWSVLSLEAWAN